MKKSLIALAVLAASSAAMAQSSVTLYGVSDIWMGSKKVEVNGVGQRQTVIDTSGDLGSRWGLKGSEDLGAGLSAIFTLESGFKQDTGESKTTGLLFDRQAFVGLQGGFGTVSLGRQYSAYDDFLGATEHNHRSFTFIASGLVDQNGLTGSPLNGSSPFGYVDRVSNSIAYSSPTISGFSTKILYGFGENKNAVPGQDATDVASVNIKYANGPLMVGYAYQQDKQPLVAGVQDKKKFNVIGGTYDFGVAKLNGSYSQAKDSKTKDKEYQVGVAIPLGASTVSAGYSHSKSDVGVISNTGKGFSILATYDLSKRTRLYAGVVDATAHVNNAAAETKTTIYGFGVRHNF